jgi:hypothetical protein
MASATNAPVPGKITKRLQAMALVRILPRAPFEVMQAEPDHGTNYHVHSVGDRRIPGCAFPSRTNSFVTRCARGTSLDVSIFPAERLSHDFNARSRDSRIFRPFSVRVKRGSR